MFAKVFLIALVVWGWWFAGVKVGEDVHYPPPLALFVFCVAALLTIIAFIMAIVTDFGGNTPLTGLM